MFFHEIKARFKRNPQRRKITVLASTPAFGLFKQILNIVRNVTLAVLKALILTIKKTNRMQIWGNTDIRIACIDDLSFVNLHTTCLAQNYNYHFYFLNVASQIIDPFMVFSLFGLLFMRF